MHILIPIVLTCELYVSLPRLPNLVDLLGKSKRAITSLISDVTGTNVTIDDEWIPVYFKLLAMYDDDVLKTLWGDRIKKFIPKERREIIDGLVSVLNEERLARTVPVASESIVNTR